tara:strand:- start:1847 stop:2176 length:330 start_codon:yes stop_codon:yes gene_type:complete
MNTFKTNDKYEDLNGDIRDESISLHINKVNEVNINVNYSVPNGLHVHRGYEVTEHIVCFCLMSMTSESARDICNVEDEMNIYIPTNKNKNNCMQFITDFLKNEEVSNES